eukprot:scaffold28117_cov64-Phaeocystis_antarctica.AAC.19
MPPGVISRGLELQRLDERGEALEGGKQRRRGRGVSERIGGGGGGGGGSGGGGGGGWLVGRGREGREERGEGAELFRAHKELRVAQEAVGVERHQALLSGLELEAHEPTVIRRRTELSEHEACGRVGRGGRLRVQGERRAAEAHELDGGQRRAACRLALVLDPKPL